jgi:hypothetical protein
MLWLLEVWLAYLRSDDFDQDTAMLSPDILVYHDLRKLFKADLSLIIRSGDKYREKPLLNGAQFWRVSAKAALVDFYEQVLELGHQCNEAEKRWGADTTPILALIEPLQDGPVHAGKMQRSDLSICGLEAFSCFRTIKLGELKGKNKVSWPAVPIIDFKSRRKQSMAAFYHATIGSRVPA